MPDDLRELVMDALGRDWLSVTTLWERVGMWSRSSTRKVLNDLVEAGRVETRIEPNSIMKPAPRQYRLPANPVR